MDAIMRSAAGGQSRLVQFAVNVFHAIERSRLAEADVVIRRYLLSLDDRRLAELGYDRLELLKKSPPDGPGSGPPRLR